MNSNSELITLKIIELLQTKVKQLELKLKEQEITIRKNKKDSNSNVLSIQDKLLKAIEDLAKSFLTKNYQYIEEFAKLNLEFNRLSQQFTTLMNTKEEMNQSQKISKFNLDETTEINFNNKITKFTETIDYYYNNKNKMKLEIEESSSFSLPLQTKSEIETINYQLDDIVEKNTEIYLKKEEKSNNSLLLLQIKNQIDTVRLDNDSNRNVEIDQVNIITNLIIYFYNKYNKYLNDEIKKTEIKYSELKLETTDYEINMMDESRYKNLNIYYL